MTTTPEGAGDLEQEQKEKPQGLDPKAAARFWAVQLELSERDHKDFVQRGERIEKRYKADRDEYTKLRKSGKRFAILYSNTETLKSALYARTPKPDVRRRFADRNPVARTGADIIERALSYCADNTRHDRAFKRGVQDCVLPGRGIVWLEYEAEIKQAPVIDPMTGQPGIGPDGQPMMQEVVADQDVEEHYVYWKDFLHSPARSWDHIWWIGRRHRMTREDMRENGFEKADEVPLNWSPDIDNKRQSDRTMADDIQRAEVWEIWDKSREQRFWIVKGFPEALRIDEDPYGLEGFWPCAEPIQGVTGNDTFIPSPDFSEYEDQADDLDELTARISVLTKALRRRGVYDASIEELKRLARAGDNEFIPSKNFQMLASKGGLAVAFQTEDIQPTAMVLVELYKQREQLVQSIYEVTGISDIMRGATKSDETATAQNIKAQFGSMRLKDRQREVQRWVRDTYRIKAELMAEHFEPHVLAEMTGMNMQDPNFMQAIQLIKQDKARGYQVDIETDSTVFEDAEQEKQSRTELLTAMGGFAQQWLPVVQAQPLFMPLVGEMLAFGVRGFKAGRSLEDAIDQTMQQIQQQLANPQPPPPDPAVMKVEAEMKRDEQSHQMDMATKQIDLQTKQQDAQLHQFKAAVDIQKATAMADAKQPAIGPDGNMLQ